MTEEDKAILLERFEKVYEKRKTCPELLDDVREVLKPDVTIKKEEEI